MVGWIVIGSAIAGVALLAWVASVYNRLVTMRQRQLNAFAQIDVQLKRRHDLIPNLVETVKGYMAHERETLTAVTAARNAAAEATARAAADPRDSAAVLAAAGAENQLLAALQRFMVLKEAYPDLKADQQAGRLMEELASTENRVAFARQAYNDAVTTYNAERLKFPHSLVANAARFEEAALFRIDDARERELVEVKL